MLLWAVSCVVLVAGVYGACEEDIQMTQAYLDCTLSYSQYISGIDPTQMMVLMCSEEADGARECFETFYQQCPALKESSQFAQQHATLCGGGGPGAMPGGDGSMPGMPSAECMAAMQCMQTASGGATGSPWAPPGSGMAGAGGSSPPPTGMPEPSPAEMYSSVQGGVKMTCGPVAEMMGCMEANPDCDTIKEMVQNMTKEMSKGGSGMSYDKMVAFVKTQCPNIPEDFGENTCVTTQLKDATFMACMQGAEQNASKKEETDENKCEFYQASTECMETAVSEPCGVEYYNALVTVTKTFVPNFPTTCETSAASIAQASLLTLLASILLMFKLF